MTKFLLLEVEGYDQQSVKFQRHDRSPWIIFFVYFGCSIKVLVVCGFIIFSPSAGFLESRFSFLNQSSISFTILLCCKVCHSPFHCVVKWVCLKCSVVIFIR